MVRLYDVNVFDVKYYPEGHLWTLLSVILTIIFECCSLSAYTNFANTTWYSAHITIIVIKYVKKQLYVRVVCELLLVVHIYILP